MLVRVRARQADRAGGPADAQNGQENSGALVAGVDRVHVGRKPSLDPLCRLLSDELERVNQLIVQRMQSPVALIPQLAGHIVAGGGKRLRPMLTLGCARLCGYRGGRHIALAAAVEFIHTATLLHDDVVDASDLRRGRDTANAVWGNKPPILVGDFLFSRSFELMVADGSLRILEILSRASSVIAEGEVLQLMTANDTRTSEAAYLAVIQAKTAELFAAASRIGAVMAERPLEEEEALDRFGRNLGIAFQLVDDMLDFSAHPTELGKSIGNDFRDGKVTRRPRRDSITRPQLCCHCDRCTIDLSRRDRAARSKRRCRLCHGAGFLTAWEAVMIPASRGPRVVGRTTGAAVESP
jgi:octaprenyl-diphosphate synthase